jgi:hypothetical protein
VNSTFAQQKLQNLRKTKHNSTHAEVWTFFWITNRYQHNETLTFYTFFFSFRTVCFVARNIYSHSNEQTFFLRLWEPTKTKMSTLCIFTLFNFFYWPPGVDGVGGPKHVAINKQMCWERDVCTFIYITLKSVTCILLVANIHNIYI